MGVQTYHISEIKITYSENTEMVLWYLPYFIITHVCNKQGCNTPKVHIQFWTAGKKERTDFCFLEKSQMRPN